MESTPAGNLRREAVQREVAYALDALQGERARLDALARQRATDLLQDHERVRQAAGRRAVGGQHQVQACLPVDVLGVYVLLPDAARLPTRGGDVYTRFNIDRRSDGMTTAVKVEQTVQEWGNGLGVRITAPVAKAARFARGLPVTVEVVAEGILVRPAASKPKLTLAQKLEAFDPARHGGEAMADRRVGVEVF